MRPLFIALLAAGLALPAHAADQTLFGEDDTWNLFSRFEVKFSEMGNDDAFFGGLQVGGILNDQLAIGLAGYALLSETEVAPNGYNNPEDFDIVYGGLTLEYRFFANKLLHATIGGLVGAGQIRLDRSVGGGDEKIELLVLEPQVNLVLNITQRSELGLGVGYRHADPYGSDIEGLERGDMSGLVGSLFIRFTEF